MRHSKSFTIIFQIFFLNFDLIWFVIWRLVSDFFDGREKTMMEKKSEKADRFISSMVQSAFLKNKQETTPSQFC